jgi:SAM-dependent methyltransferase
LDRQIEPLGQAAIDALVPRSAERIVDVGCGCGQTTLALARRVGPTGFVLGVDISRPLLQIARSRPRDPGLKVDFRELDAQVGNLAAAGGDARFDAVYSRFGVMFFGDPVAAFANIRNSLHPGGRLAFVCWRPLAENDWMRLPLEAALPLLPPMPAADPTAPGPFAFADAGRVTEILRAAGYVEIVCRKHDAFIGGGDLEQTLNLSLNLGPLGAVLREQPQYTAPVSRAVRAVLERYVTPAGVLMPAAVWIVGAQVPTGVD